MKQSVSGQDADVVLHDYGVDNEEKTNMSGQLALQTLAYDHRIPNKQKDVQYCIMCYASSVTFANGEISFKSTSTEKCFTSLIYETISRFQYWSNIIENCCAFMYCRLFAKYVIYLHQN